MKISVGRVRHTNAAFNTGTRRGNKGIVFSAAPSTISNSLKPSFETNV